MKRVLSVILILVIAANAIPTGFAFAATKESGTTGDCTWELDGTTLTISGEGSMDEYCLFSPWFSGEVESVIIENGVTSIGSGAFEYCESLTSITISDSVTSIGYRAFSGCHSLTSITIPNSVTSIGEDAFIDSGVYKSDNCKNGVLYIDNCLIKVVDEEQLENHYNIEPDTRLIADFAFRCCDSLENIEIPNAVISIGEGAFFYCDSLKSVEIPNSVTSIGAEAFADCESLKSIVIPNSVTSISAGAFKRCESFTSITIPNSVTSIGVEAFYDCYRLKNITIPNSVTNIGDSTFSGCESLKSVEIPNSVTSIGEYAFSACFHLKNITIPNSVTSIGEDAFYDVNEDFVIYGEKGSYAEMYANDYDIPFSIHKPGCMVVTKATASKDGKIAKICDTCKKTISTTTIYKASNLKLSAVNYTYNGKVKTPSVTVKDSKGKTLKKNTDYTVSYSKGRKNVGRYAVTVKFKGDYSGTKTLYFTINPKGTNLSSVKSSKTKTATVKWKAQKTQTSGYQIRYSTKSNFKSSKILTVSKNSTVSKTISKLAKKKTYYFSIRTYKTVGKTKFCSSWSGSKKVKIK